MARYEVIVGNVGTVYDGPSKREAQKKFALYKKQSHVRGSRVFNEDIIILRNGDIYKDHEGWEIPEKDNI